MVKILHNNMCLSLQICPPCVLKLCVSQVCNILALCLPPIGKLKICFKQVSEYGKCWIINIHASDFCLLKAVQHFKIYKVYL